MYKKYFLIFLFFIFINISYSTSFSSCTTLSSGTWELNSSLTQSGGNCIEITGNNVILDCQNNNITGDGTGIGIYVTGDYANVSNCNIFNFNLGVQPFTSSNNTFSFNGVHNNLYGFSLTSSSSSNTLISNTAKNNSRGIYSASNSNQSLMSNILLNNADGIYLSTGYNHSLISNIFTNNSNGITLLSGSNNILINNSISDSDSVAVSIVSSSNNILISNNLINNNQGVSFSSAENNILTENIILNNSVLNLMFFAFSGGPYTNLIYDNDLGNISKISSNDWSFFENQFNLSTQGNRYLNESFSIGTFCFDPDNCDYSAIFSPLISPEINFSSTTSSLPFGSVLISMLLLFSFFIIY